MTVSGYQDSLQSYGADDMNWGWSQMTRFARCDAYFRIVFLVELVFAFSNLANAADVSPLTPVDTSSPRATLQSFVGTMDEIYRGMRDILQSYVASGRLYLTL
jgi:hypothetical protein